MIKQHLLCAVIETKITCDHIQKGTNSTDVRGDFFSRLHCSFWTGHNSGNHLKPTQHHQILHANSYLSANLSRFPHLHSLVYLCPCDLPAPGAEGRVPAPSFSLPCPTCVHLSPGHRNLEELSAGWHHAWERGEWAEDQALGLPLSRVICWIGSAAPCNSSIWDSSNSILTRGSTSPQKHGRPHGLALLDVTTNQC